MAVFAALLDALVAQLPAVVGSAVTVTDGPVLTKTFGDVLAVGAFDPASSAPATSASGTTIWSDSHGRRMSEEGVISMVAYSWAGAADVKSLRDRVVTVHGQVLAWIRAQQNPFLGVAGVWDLRPATFSLDQQQDGSGAWAVLAFQLHYQAKL